MDGVTDAMSRLHGLVIDREACPCCSLVFFSPWDHKELDMTE